MFAIANGRKALWQWDLNQQLTVAGDCTEVHYLDRGAPSTLTVAVKDGKADIPNILLQKAGRLVVYAYIIDAQDHHTKVCETFGIAPRPKPAEYVYTETEVKTWSDLQSQIGDLANLATDEKDSLVAAINEAAKSGGGAGAWYVTLTPDDDGNITADKTMAEIEAAYQEGYAVYCIYLYFIVFISFPIIAPLTIHRENAQYTFCGVGAMDKLYSFQFELTENGWTVLQKEIPQKSDIPAAYILPKATANALGGVKADPATADDTQPVRIDDSGKLVTAAGSGSGEVWEKVAELTTTEDVQEVNISPNNLNQYTKLMLEFDMNYSSAYSGYLNVNGKNSSFFALWKFDYGSYLNQYGQILLSPSGIPEVPTVIHGWQRNIGQQKTISSETIRKGEGELATGRLLYNYESVFPCTKIRIWHGGTIVSGSLFILWGCKK